MLTLLCPDALPEADDTPDHAGSAAANRSAGGITRLATLLRRSRVLDEWADPQAIPRMAPAHRWLAARFGLPGNWQPGAFRALDTQGDRTGAHATPHMVMTPAHLHAGLDHLVLQPPALLAVTLQEAQALVETSNRFFAADNLALKILTPGCWVMKSAEAFDVQTCDHALAVGRNVDAYLPDGPDARRLRSVLNEMQMLWHEHPVNQARQEQHLPPINTLWVEGYLPSADAVPSPATATATACPVIDVVLSADPVTRGLARFAGASVRPAAEQLESDLAGNLAGTTQTTLVELPAGPDALEQLLVANPDLNAELVLTNSQRWLHLRIARADRLRLWRRTALARKT